MPGEDSKAGFLFGHFEKTSETPEPPKKCYVVSLKFTNEEKTAPNKVLNDLNNNGLV